MFLAVQEKWKHSLNCWSASPSIAARVLSNWYPINEGVQLYGATYDWTEHFWQAVKYHPDTTVGEVTALVSVLEKQDWGTWLARLDDNPKIYLPNAYAVEFLRANLKPECLRQFRKDLGGHGLRPDEKARTAQQRGETPFRFSAFEEKTLWEISRTRFTLCIPSRRRTMPYARHWPSTILMRSTLERAERASSAMNSVL